MRPPQIPIMPFVVLALLVWPTALAPRRLKQLAFAIWLAGGVVLCSFGLVRLSAARSAGAGVWLALTLGLAAGAAKSVLILVATSRRNIARLDALPGPMRPIRVYDARSWTVIGAMTAVAVGLNLGWIPLSLVARGGVNIAIGTALILSSFTYISHG
ncbi:MAG: hypothetical protein PHS14_16880 [Elusimicrobia bacterium]|nr:hypothetical protein [Elusimicrobiota bacterium]